MQGSTNRPVVEQEPGVSSEEASGGEQSKSSRAVGTVQDHTREVATHAAEEAKGVVEEAVDRLHGEAEHQTHQVQQALQRAGSQLGALADGRVEDAGPLADYARRASTKVDEVATRMERLGFDGIVSEVSAYARRRPGRFLLVSTAAGVVVGRLGRNLRAARDGEGSVSPRKRSLPTASPSASPGNGGDPLATTQRGSDLGTGREGGRDG